MRIVYLISAVIFILSYLAIGFIFAIVQNIKMIDDGREKDALGLECCKNLVIWPKFIFKR